MRSLHELMEMNGRVAVVTGGAGHVGTAICDALAELGAEIAVVDRDATRCQSVATSIQQQHQTKAVAAPIDLSGETDLRKFRSKLLERIDRIDVLVNCAAFVAADGLNGWTTDFSKQSIATWRQAMDVNLTAPFALTQAFSEDLKKSGHGNVINISSIYGVIGPDWRLYEGTSMGNPGAYSVSKGGLVQLTRWLATTLAPRVRVNAVSPGGLERGQDAGFQQRYISRTPLARMGTEEDLKGVVAYLASDMSTWVTGQNFVIDGGFTAW